MVNILLITDQVRLEQLIFSAAQACNAHVRHISSLQIPEEAKTDQPAVIFIQNRLSGLSGDILARHLRTVFNSGSAAIILLSEDPGDVQRTSKLADNCINLAESDAAIIQKATDTINEAARLGAMDRAETSLAAVEIGDRVSISGGPVPVQESSPVDSPFLHKLEGALTDLEPVPLQPGEERETVSFPARADEMAALSLSGDRGAHQRRIWVASTLAIALAVCVFFFLGGKGGKPSPARLSTEEHPIPQGMTGLPAFIPPQGLDAGYGQAHPGWERYSDKVTEFKLFRQKGVIQALQIIDRSGKGVPAPLVDTALRLSAGTSRYTIATTVTKSGYTIEKGSAGKAGIIIYRRGTDRQMKGFVLYLDDQNMGRR